MFHVDYRESQLYFHCMIHVGIVNIVNVDFVSYVCITIAYYECSGNIPTIISRRRRRRCYYIMSFSTITVTISFSGSILPVLHCPSYHSWIQYSRYATVKGCVTVETLLVVALDQHIFDWWKSVTLLTNAKADNSRGGDTTSCPQDNPRMTTSTQDYL